MSIDIVNVGYDAVNFYVILSDAIPRMMVDCGWPNTINKLMAQLEKRGIELEQIGHLLVTHYHPDHAGLVKDLKNAGIMLVAMETQLPSAEQLTDPKNLTAKYIEMQLKGSVILKGGQSRDFLKELQIAGEIVQTPGHSHDSVTLILDEGIAFTGDLAMEVMLSEDDQESRESWKKIRERGVHLIYPGHGKVQEL